MNKTSNETSLVWITHEAGVTTWRAIMIFLMVMGAVLNLVLATAMLSSKKLRSGAGALVINLLLLNLSNCSIQMPLQVLSHHDTASTQGFFTPSPTFCQYNVLFYYTNVWAVDWASFMVSINRFVAIFFPHNYGKWTSIGAVTAMAVVSWMIPMVSLLTLWLSNGAKFAITKPWGACGIIPAPGSSYSGNIIMGNVGFPIASEAAIYLAIFGTTFVKWLFGSNKIAVQGAQSSDRRQAEQTSRLSDRRYRMAKMLCVSAIWYAVCFLPAPVGAGPFSKQYFSIPMLQLFFRALLLLAYATTPIIYLVHSQEYRHRVYQLWKQCLKGLRLTSTDLADEKDPIPMTGGIKQSSGGTNVVATGKSTVTSQGIN